MPAEAMPDVGVIGVLSDPQGAVFALYQHLNRT
jgi:predicted enzyme related to lactoylglutathione lyase